MVYRVNHPACCDWPRANVLNPLFIRVEHVHETFYIVALADAGLLFAHLQASHRAGIGCQWPAQNIVPVGVFFRLGFFDVLPHPITDLAIRDGLFHDLHKLFMRHAGGLEPESVKRFSQIFLIIHMQFAGEVQADFINVAGQVMPAVHGFARASGINKFTHAGIIGQSV